MSVLPDRGAGSARRHRPRLRHRGGIPRYAPSRSHPCPADPPRARRVGGRPGSAPRGDAGGAVRGCGTRGEGGAHRPERLAPGVQRRAGRRPECLSPAFSPPGGTRPGVAPRLSHVPAPGGGGYTRPPGPRRGLVFETEPRRTQLAEAKTNPTRTEVKILVPDQQPMVALVGQADALLKLVERAFDARIVVRGNEISISGPPGEVERAALLFEELLALLEQGHELSADSLGRTIDMIKDDAVRPTQVFGDTLLTVRGRILRPKTFGQKRYVDAIRKATITFAVGPAGTGKTYLAVAAAVKALQERDVMRIILTRPAVEAGERLGFLPGTLYEKIDPYLKPLYDALFDMMDAEAFNRLMERGTIEVAPLAYMRGRTLNDSFIILDEAQNTTPEQMKMFLTRLGFGSKAVVTGDVTQIDLPSGSRSGLVVVEEILTGIEGLRFMRLGAKDVVRHRIVQDIVEAYRTHGERSVRRQATRIPDRSGRKGIDGRQR